MKIFLSAIRFFQRDARSLWAALGLLLAGIALSLLKPWPLAWIVDCVLGGAPLPEGLSALAGAGPMRQITVLAAGMAALYLLHAAVSGLQTFLLIQTGLRGLRRVRSELFQSLQGMDWRAYQKARSGDLLYRATWDSYAFQTFLHRGVFQLIQAALTLLLMLGIMFRMNPSLTGWVLMTAVPLIFAMRFFGRTMVQRGLTANEADSRVGTLIQQALLSLPLIRSFGAERQAADCYKLHEAHAYARRLNQHRAEVWHLALTAALFAAAFAGVTWLGATQVLAGGFRLGQLLVFLAYLGQLYEPLNQLAQVGATLSESSAGIRRVMEILNGNPRSRKTLSSQDAGLSGRDPSNIEFRTSNAEYRMDARDGPKALSEIEGVEDEKARMQPKPTDTQKHERALLRMEGVGLSDEAGRSILRDICFEVREGEILLIVGPSGSGKTSLLHLIPRLYEPTQGVVYFRGVPAREMSTARLRESVSLASQDPLFLPTSIAENIALGDPLAPFEEIQACARKSRAHEFIQALPQGYDTVIGEGGAYLSAGEKQRIHLARAFLKPAPLLILDEPTQSLDADTALQVIETLRDFASERTVLVVDHRPELAAIADHVLVMEKGAIQAAGAPGELAGLSKYYDRMVRGKHAKA